MLKIGVPDIVSGYHPPEGVTNLSCVVTTAERGAVASSSSGGNSNSAIQLKGCNTIVELFLTVSTATSTNLDRLQRLAIMRRTPFHADLVTVAVGDSSSAQLRQSALDLLLWLLLLHTPNNKRE